VALVSFLLANLGSEDSGIEGAIVWFAAGEYSRNEVAYGPKILVALGTARTLDGLAGAVSVTIASPPQVLGTLPTKVMDQVVRFIDKNRSALLRHWRGEFYTIDVLQQLERV
jgi:hypothetical protein